MAPATLKAALTATLAAALALGSLSSCDNAHADQNTQPAKPAPAPQPTPSTPAKPVNPAPTQPTPAPPPAAPATVYENVTISGKKFKLELVADPITRFKGLSGRTEIPEDGGMLFVFDRPSVQQFVMRDCPVAIDIIYLDGTGRVVSFYKMVPEPPRTAEEKINDKGQTFNKHYEERLKKYHSKFAAQFVIELKGNTLDGLTVKANDKFDLDVLRLKKLAK